MECHFECLLCLVGWLYLCLKFALHISYCISTSPVLATFESPSLHGTCFWEILLDILFPLVWANWKLMYLPYESLMILSGIWFHSLLMGSPYAVLIWCCQKKSHVTCSLINPWSKFLAVNPNQEFTSNNNLSRCHVCNFKTFVLPRNPCDFLGNLNIPYTIVCYYNISHLSYISLKPRIELNFPYFSIIPSCGMLIWISIMGHYFHSTLH